MNNSEIIYNFLKEKGMSNIAIYGIMGNLQQESGLLSNNLQNEYNKSFGVNDQTYTENVNNGTYTKEQFSTDNAAYGLCQWKVEDRKTKLYDFAKENNTTIDDLDMQLEFMWQEMCEKDNLVKELNDCTSINESTYLFAKKFEGCTANIDCRTEYALGFSEYFIEKEEPKFNFLSYGDIGKQIQDLVDNNKSDNIYLKNGDMLFVENIDNSTNIYINGLKIAPENLDRQLTDIYYDQITPTATVDNPNNDYIVALESNLRRMMSYQQDLI